MKLSADTPSMENHGARTSTEWSPVAAAPRIEELRAAADLLNSADKVAILADQGALGARTEVERTADLRLYRLFADLLFATHRD